LQKAIDKGYGVCYNTVETDNTDNTDFERKETDMQLNFSGKQDVYVEIAEKYKSYIRLGVIKNGEKLPSVREAAGELGVNPNTIARAYSLLEEQGYVRALPKKGAFVIYGEAEERKEPDKREIIYALRDMGISKNTLINWIEEVYKDD
jgi:GntR family transcriptional regulator